MSIERIERANDPRVAAYQGVRDGELLRSRGLFVAEGRHIFRRIVTDGRYRVQSVLVNEAAQRDLERTIAELDAEAAVFVCRGDELAAIAGYDVHRGCLALVYRLPATTVDALIAPA